MKLPFYSVAVIAMCLLCACNGSANKEYSTADVTLSKPEDQTLVEESAKLKSSNFTIPQGIIANDVSVPNADTTALVASAPSPDVLHAGGPAYQDWDKKIIKTARITLELKEYASFNTGIHDKLKRYGAYIAGEQQTESDKAERVFVWH